MKKISIYVLIGVLLVLGYFVGTEFLKSHNANDLTFEISKNDKNTLTEEKYYERNIELHKCIDISKEAVEQLRKLVNDNISNINEKNCSGLLADIDKDKIYDKSILGIGITSNDTSVQIHYNFCSVLYSNQEPIIITLTTDKLLEEFVVEKEFGDRFVPTFNVKQSKNLKKPGEFITEESVGLINLEDFLIN